MMALIICAYNEELELPAALETLGAQVDPDFHLVLVNNASTDHTRLAMDRFQKRTRIPTLVVDEPRIGRLHALATGLEAARELGAEIVSFSDADVSFTPTWSADVKRFFADRPEVSFGYGLEIFRHRKLAEVPRFARLLSIYTRWLHESFRGIGGIMVLANASVRAAALREVGGFEASWRRKSEDTLLTFKLMSHGLLGGYCAARLYVSPRRLLAPGNPTRWCLDHNLKAYVSLGAGEALSPIRERDLEGAREDVAASRFEQTLVTRSQRIFRRSLLLAAFELSSARPVHRNLARLCASSDVASPLRRFFDDLPGIRSDVWKLHADTASRADALERLLRIRHAELLRLGGRLIRGRYGDLPCAEPLPARSAPFYRAAS